MSCWLCNELANSAPELQEKFHVTDCHVWAVKQATLFYCLNIGEIKRSIWKHRCIVRTLEKFCTRPIPSKRQYLSCDDWIRGKTVRTETCLALLFLGAAATHRNLEPKRAENVWLWFASSTHLLQQTEQKAKIMAERWRQLSKHLLRKSSFKRV